MSASPSTPTTIQIPYQSPVHVSSSSQSHAADSPSRSSTLAVPNHPMITRGKARIVKPKKLFSVSKHPLPPADEPGVSKALPYHEWKQAMFEEFTALMTTGTWSLVPN